MNQELAKKLKDAGFPQKYHWKSPGVLDHYTTEEYLKDPVKNSPIEIPTLSELIAACTEISGYVNCHFDREQNNITNTGKWDDVNGWQFEGKGSTPEESFANLWLKLNKKSA